jgi:putative addiction module component (TIGR02574 family)
MTTRTEALLREALSLADDERAALAAELLASLDDPADDPDVVEAAWAAELARRAGRVMRGESAGEAWADVRQRLASRLQER